MNYDRGDERGGDRAGAARPRPRTIGRWLCWAVLLGMVAIQCYALLDYRAERRLLAEKIGRIVPASAAPSEQVLRVLASFKDLPAVENDSYFLLPAFAFLRPTAEQVSAHGGDCADRSRLLIRMLEERGLQARKWALHSADGQPRHAVVEAFVESGPMVVDPLFGLWFPAPGGGYHGITDLQLDPLILPRRVEGLTAAGRQPGAGRLEFYPLDEYTYSHPKTINWDKSFVTRGLYRALRFVIGERVDSIGRPAFAEAPQLMVAIGLLFAEALLLVALLLLLRRAGRAGDPR